jgi:hypothetical protein
MFQEGLTTMFSLSLPALRRRLAPLAAVGTLLAAMPATAQAPNGAAESQGVGDSTMILIVAKRLGETVYCRSEPTDRIGKGCMNRSSWRRQGVTIVKPVRPDGTVLAYRAASGSAASR